MITLKLTKLKNVRENKGWTQETLAELSGLSVRTIQRLESGGGASSDSATAISLALSLQDYTPLISDTGETIVIAPSERNTIDCSSDSNSQLSTGGITFLIVIALFFMLMHNITPPALSVFLLLANLIIFMVVMIKMLKAVGIWTDVLNVFTSIFNRYPIPGNHDDKLPFGDILKLMGIAMLFAISLFIGLPTITVQ
jgi:transcriptional regulator with XRE-family HTH domain